MRFSQSEESPSGIGGGVPSSSDMFRNTLHGLCSIAGGGLWEAREQAPSTRQHAEEYHTERPDVGWKVSHQWLGKEALGREIINCSVEVV